MSSQGPVARVCVALVCALIVAGVVIWLLSRTERVEDNPPDLKEEVVPSSPAGHIEPDKEKVPLQMAHAWSVVLQSYPHSELEELQAYTAECNNGSTQSCLSLGRMYVKGRGVPSDLELAATIYASACSNKASEDSLEREAAFEACYYLANMYRRGLGVEKDVDLALGMFLGACHDGKNAKACTNSGYLFAGEPGFDEEVASHYKMGCTLGDPKGCNNWAAHRCEENNICDKDALLFALQATELDTSGLSHSTLGNICCRRGELSDATEAWILSCRRGYKRACAKDCLPDTTVGWRVELQGIGK